MARRETIVRQATALFAARGYKATTVAMIEAAAGLSPGAGGFYRHFSSKQAVLEAAIRLAEENQLRPALADARLFQVDDLEAAFGAIAEGVFAAADTDADLYALLLQPDGALPIPVAELRERLVAPGVERLALWLELVARTGRVRDDLDFRAAAAVATASLVWYHYCERLTGAGPGGVERDRFARTWVAAQVAYLADRAG